MNRDDIIRMAREAGVFETRYNPVAYSATPEALERFAALVAAAERDRIADEAKHIIKRAEARGAAAEREVIAQSLDKQADLACDDIDRQWAQEMAAAVRARGEKP